MFQNGPLKPPDLNGFLARFFQRHWGILKGQVNAAIKEFFQTIIIPIGANTTSIGLIPKLDNLSKLFDFRPINLCNVIYKVLAPSRSTLSTTPKSSHQGQEVTRGSPMDQPSGLPVGRSRRREEGLDVTAAT